MDIKKRKYLNAVTIFTGSLVSFKMVPMARACMYDRDTIYFPTNILTDFSKSPFTDYMENYYGSKLQLKYDKAIIINTAKNVENSAVAPIHVKIPTEHLEDNYKNVECTNIDIFSQIMENTYGAAIYRIASYSFKNVAFDYIGSRYRREFTYSRIVVVATLTDKTSKQIIGRIYNHTENLRGGQACGYVRPS